jgi:hypothetical protein
MEILDPKYDKADLPNIVKSNWMYLSTSHRNSLLVLLLKFKELFNGTLGDWKLPPVSFELMEGATSIRNENLSMDTYHLRPL